MEYFQSFFITLVGVVQLLKGNAFMLEGCPKPWTITTLMHQTKLANSEQFKINTHAFPSPNWKSCFLSCCRSSYCRQVVYSRDKCIYVRCMRGSQGFCKYRPSKLKEGDLHGIIVRHRPKGQSIGQQLDQLQFRNGPSLVTSEMRFTHSPQCAQYVEPENVTGVATSWATKRFAPFKYLYRDNGDEPPLGMRSAVPLGGLGTGSFELRADGTFNEWTLENQSPGGSAKLSRGALDLAFLAVRVQTQNGIKASLLRTHPPRGLPGVAGLSYSGGYPVSKLGIEDGGFFGLKMELFAYSSIKARSATDSALPAVIFSLRVRNPTSSKAEVSLLLNLPLGEQPDTSRKGYDYKIVQGIKSSVECARLCRDHPTCMAWSLRKTTCRLKDTMPLHAYRKGVTSGVKNTWERNYGRITCNRPGQYPNSGNTTIMWVPNNRGYHDDNYGNHDDTGQNKRDYVTGVGNGDGYFDNDRGYYDDNYGNHANNQQNKRDFVTGEENGDGYYKNDYIKSRSYYDKQYSYYYNYYYNYYNNEQKTTKKNIKANKQTTNHQKLTKHKITFSSAVSDDIYQIWSFFSKYGHLRKMVSSDSGFYGSGVSKMSLGPGEEGTISLVMSLYYPYRDHAGEYVGQYYRNIFKSSEDVAFHTKQNLPKILDELNSWRDNMMPSYLSNSNNHDKHDSKSNQLQDDYKNYDNKQNNHSNQSALSNQSDLSSYDNHRKQDDYINRDDSLSNHDVFRVKSSVPDWLQDMLVNSLSYWRTGFWVADGRWRQWETFDCNDIDSVHNDFQRELPYILFFPGLLENVVRGWARHQLDSGLILEALQGQFGCWYKTNKLDAVGGRYNMADVIPSFIAQMFHLYKWAGKEKLLQDLWPSVRKATLWMIQNTTNGTGIPHRMTNTYDILQLQTYDHSFYNSVMYILGLRTTEELAGVMKDGDMFLLVREGIAKAEEQIERFFWDEQRGYYRAWWDGEKGSPPWLMADSLYGQVWAYTLGLGELLPAEKMRSHLENEALLNDTPYGLQVITKNERKMEQKPTEPAVLSRKTSHEDVKEKSRRNTDKRSQKLHNISQKLNNKNGRKKAIINDGEKKQNNTGNDIVSETLYQVRNKNNFTRNHNKKYQNTKYSRKISPKKNKSKHFENNFTRSHLKNNNKFIKKVRKHLPQQSKKANFKDNFFKTYYETNQKMRKMGKKLSKKSKNENLKEHLTRKHKNRPMEKQKNIDLEHIVLSDFNESDVIRNTDTKIQKTIKRKELRKLPRNYEDFEEHLNINKDDLNQKEFKNRAMKSLQSYKENFKRKEEAKHTQKMLKNEGIEAMNYQDFVEKYFTRKSHKTKQNILKKRDLPARKYEDFNEYFARLRNDILYNENIGQTHYKNILHSYNYANQPWNKFYRRPGTAQPHYKERDWSLASKYFEQPYLDNLKEVRGSIFQKPVNILGYQTNKDGVPVVSSQNSRNKLPVVKTSNIEPVVGLPGMRFFNIENEDGLPMEKASNIEPKFGLPVVRYPNTEEPNDGLPVETFSHIKPGNGFRVVGSSYNEPNDGLPVDTFQHIKPWDGNGLPVVGPSYIESRDGLPVAGYSSINSRNGLPVDDNIKRIQESQMGSNNVRAESDINHTSTEYLNGKVRGKIANSKLEKQHNRTHTKCSSLHKVFMYKSIWMGASPDWTSLQLYLGSDPYTALEQTRKALDHYRTKLNDLWNIHGLTAGQGHGLDGQPWCTSHYTFHIVLWHIPLALSGQQYSIIDRKLGFHPKLKAPYSLPFFVPYASGTIEANLSRDVISLKLTVTHGYLVLKELSISGITWPGGALKLEKGESVIWS